MSKNLNKIVNISDPHLNRRIAILIIASIITFFSDWYDQYAKP